MPTPALLAMQCFLRNTIKEEYKSVMNDPSSGVIPQIRSLNDLITDPKTGILGKVSINSTTLKKHERLLTTKDGLVSSVNKLKEDVKQLQAIGGKVTAPASGCVARIEKLEKTVDDESEGFNALSLAVQSLQSDVSDPSSGLLTKFKTMEKNFSKISQAVDVGETQVSINASQEDQVKLDELKESFNSELSLVQGKLEESQKEIVSLQKELKMVRTTVASNATKIETVGNIVHVQHKSMNRMKENIILNASKHMRNELIVGGIREEPREDCIELARRFFYKKMHLDTTDDEIMEAHWGKSSKRRVFDGKSVDIPPVLFLKVSPHFGMLAIKYAWRLKNQQECLPAVCRTCLSVKFSKKKKSYCCHLVLTFDIRICGPPGVNI